jgi:hypothetical protein
MLRWSSAWACGQSLQDMHKYEGPCAGCGRGNWWKELRSPVAFTLLNETWGLYIQLSCYTYCKCLCSPLRWDFLWCKAPQSNTFCCCYCCVYVCVCVCVCVFSPDRVSLCILGCSGTHSIDQAGLDLRDSPASASPVLGLKACTTTTWF